MDMIENLKEERLARKKAKAIETRLKNIKKIKRRRYTTVIYAILAILAIGGVSVLVSYCANSGDNAFLEEPQYATEAPTDAPTPMPSEGIDAVLNSDGYLEVNIQNATFTYPEAFKNTGDTQGKMLVMGDTEGDATITVSKEITSHDAKSLMANYRDSIENAKALDSRAGSSGYSITVSAGDMIYHKKSYVSGGAELYYEIVYPANSKKASEYEAAIKYMDEHFVTSAE